MGAKSEGADIEQKRALDDRFGVSLKRIIQYNLF
jgi:hypothetical protein